MKTSSAPLFRAVSRALLVTLAAGLVAGAAIAQDFRIGFVNTERIFREANLAKAAQTKLEQEFARREKEVQGLSAALKPSAHGASVNSSNRTATSSASSVSSKKT